MSDGGFQILIQIELFLKSSNLEARMVASIFVFTHHVETCANVDSRIINEPQQYEIYLFLYFSNQNEDH